MILFLDFDGVLHPGNVVLRRNRPHLDAPGELFMWTPALVEVLADAPHVQLVLSTSWVRHLGFSRAREALPAALASRVIGATWHTELLEGRSKRDMCGWDLLSRYAQIERYVLRAKLDSWIAVDDDVEGWPDTQSEQLIQTDSDCGLGDPIVIERLRRRLVPSG
ncbi:HAD domain-containing protein [Niveibacterium sp. 24ML]|uniref:HAD domain-containing protein n=1 Tax=Niveibacterium sp. 24ML TaxID=2985512 RepID=UPI00226F3893|nr:HAD domain-containing protein [Niveibacterium sp. 24ML]MCX9158033.1 HAD domain-containing protein [Niveibacterium sp. 24ML]